MATLVIPGLTRNLTVILKGIADQVRNDEDHKDRMISVGE
jgi:hypothetical protein